MFDSDLFAMRDRLLKARFAGLREVRDSNGETVVYKSDSEMAAALVALDQEIKRRSGNRPVTTIRFSTSKGL